MDIRKVIVRVRRELNNVDMFIASIEAHLAGSLDKPGQPSSPTKFRDWFACLNPPFQEPEFGLWVREDL